jgi:hypothetical protein
MPRKSREDGPDTLHHIYNRGLAQRTVFEGRDDIRFFQSRLARMHRKGILETHGFSFLTNHFHLIVRSPKAELSRAIQLIVNPFVRRFNRLRGRDGPLFKGRFGSRRVRSLTELTRLVPYVDQNSKEARLTSHAELYPHGSARLFQCERSPRWHTRDLLENLACRMSGASVFSPAVYRECFGVGLSPAEAEWIELRMKTRANGPDPLDDLVGAAPSSVQEWMVQRARMADGSGLLRGPPLVGPLTIREVIRELEREDPFIQVAHRGRNRRVWPLLEIGLLRESCSLTITSIARLTGRAVSTISEAVRADRELLGTDQIYAALAARALADALQRMHGAATARLRQLDR